MGAQKNIMLVLFVKKKYGCKVNTPWGLCYAVKKTLNNEKIVEKWHDNLMKNSKNESTKKILELVNRLLK